MVTCLKLKFWERVYPSYCIKQIDESDLLMKSELNKLKVFKTIDGSSLFLLVIFNPCHPGNITFYFLYKKPFKLAM